MLSPSSTSSLLVSALLLRALLSGLCRRVALASIRWIPVEASLKFHAVFELQAPRRALKLCSLLSRHWLGLALALADEVVLLLPVFGGLDQLQVISPADLSQLLGSLKATVGGALAHLRAVLGELH